jgi:hypothetical protein
MSEVSLAKEPSVRKAVSSEKFILDATAGFRMMWFNKHHPNCIYLEQRPECEPDIIGDFRDLKQFADKTFRLVVFDPPHLIKKEVNNHNMVRRFGRLEPETWQFDLQKGFSECWRVLQDYGILLFKWCNFSVSTTDVLKLFPVAPLLYNIASHEQERISEIERTRSLRTLWFCFMKIPETEVLQK